MVLQNNVNALLIVPLSSPHWRYIWFTGTLSGVTMLNTNNRQLLKLSPSLTSSTRPSPLLLQRHTLGGGKQGAVGGRGSTSAGSLCSLQHPLGRLRNVGHNAVPEFGWLFGDRPWNCPRVLDDRGAPFISPRPLSSRGSHQPSPLTLLPFKEMSIFCRFRKGSREKLYSQKGEHK